MAKLSAFGRVAVLSLIRTESTPTLKWASTLLRLMSDGVVLKKFHGEFRDGAKLTGTWKKFGGRIAKGNEDSFLRYYTVRGFVKVA